MLKVSRPLKIKLFHSFSNLFVSDLHGESFSHVVFRQQIDAIHCSFLTSADRLQVEKTIIILFSKFKTSLNITSYTAIPTFLCGLRCFNISYFKCIFCYLFKHLINVGCADIRGSLSFCRMWSLVVNEIAQSLFYIFLPCCDSQITYSGLNCFDL